MIRLYRPDVPADAALHLDRAKGYARLARETSCPALARQYEDLRRKRTLMAAAAKLGNRPA